MFIVKDTAVPLWARPGSVMLEAAGVVMRVVIRIIIRIVKGFAVLWLELRCIASVVCSVPGALMLVATMLFSSGDLLFPRSLSLSLSFFASEETHMDCCSCA